MDTDNHISFLSAVIIATYNVMTYLIQPGLKITRPVQMFFVSDLKIFFFRIFQILPHIGNNFHRIIHSRIAFKHIEQFLQFIFSGFAGKLPAHQHPYSVLLHVFLLTRYAKLRTRFLYIDIQSLIYNTPFTLCPILNRSVRF